MLINICASYVSRSTGVYAATAFREYGRKDRQNICLSFAFVFELAELFNCLYGHCDVFAKSFLPVFQPLQGRGCFLYLLLR